MEVTVNMLFVSCHFKQLQYKKLNVTGFYLNVCFHNCMQLASLFVST